MPAAGGTYLDDMPPFTHYSGFAGMVLSLLLSSM
jgi:hypothetical protein